LIAFSGPWAVYFFAGEMGEADSCHLSTIERQIHCQAPFRIFTRTAFDPAEPAISALSLDFTIDARSFQRKSQIPAPFPQRFRAARQLAQYVGKLLLLGRASAAE
jgi:hypothetical protein